MANELLEAKIDRLRTSPRRGLRVMREHNLLAHQRAGSPRGPRAHDGTITTLHVDTMWGTDMTAMATGEGQAAVFIAVDHCSAECMGIHASASASRHEALESIRQGVRRSFGAFGIRQCRSDHWRAIGSLSRRG